MTDCGELEPDPILDGRIIYNESKGPFRGYADVGAPIETNTGAIYAGYSGASRGQVSWGYLDDECDGIVAVELAVDPGPYGMPRLAPDHRASHLMGCRSHGRR